MIVSTILDLPKLVPDDWEKWWSIWNEHAAELTKTRKSPNAMDGLHFGFDVYRTTQHSTTYQATFCDLKTLYPTLFEALMIVPLPITCIRFVMSKGDFPAHIDNAVDNWSIRNMFYCEDPDPQWFFTHGENKTWLTLPEESNWFAYLDGKIKHGTIFKSEYPKIIVQYFTPTYHTKQFVETQFSSYPSYNIVI